jgi:predicted ATPase
MQGRKFVCSKYYKGIGFFEFVELCDRPIGNADFIAIAQNCSTIFLKNVPTFSINNRNVLRRFINLVNKK